MRRAFCIFVILLLIPSVVFAQKKQRKRLRDLKPAASVKVEAPPDTLFFTMPDSVTNEYLDTVKIRRKFLINDYSMIGAHYGVSLMMTSFNPVWGTDLAFMPNTFGITYTRYGKMFGYMPYFGFQIGLLHTYNGYKFKYDKEKDYTRTLAGATKAVMEVLEVPFMAHMHVDIGVMKIIANLGIFGAYRWRINRTLPSEGLSFNVNEPYKPETPEDAAHGRDFLADNYVKKYYPFEYRFDYGLKGGIGFGLMFDPVEIHIMGLVQWSWNSLYHADWYSPYYYRYAYPLNFEISVGVHYQLTKRSGRTRKQLRDTAKRVVYGDE